MKKGKDYEILIERLYKKIDPDSIIKRNDKILGHNSKINREIDVSIRHRIGPHEVLMIVQVKDHKGPVDVNIVGELEAVIKDVRANKGILISRDGFTKAALTMATNLGIDALTGHDMSNPKWTIDLKMPVILSSYEGAYQVNFALEASQDYADAANSGRLPAMPPWYEWKISDDGGKTFFSINEKFHFLCAYDHLNFYDGVQHTAEFIGDDLQLYVMDGVLTPLRDFKFMYKVTRKAYYKYFDVKEFEGLINRQNNQISRANVKIESEEFEVVNYDLINKKDVDLTTWNEYDESIELIHPYKIRCALLKIGLNPTPLKFEFAGNQPE